MSTYLLPLQVLANVSGGLRPHLQGCKNRNVILATGKNKGQKSVSIRKVFRKGGITTLLWSGCEAIPAVMACHKTEHNQFVEMGPDMCVPDLAQLDERSFRNFFVMYEQGHCHLDMLTTDKAMTLQAGLVLSNPYYGTPAYYSNMPDEVIPGFKQDGEKQPEAWEFMVSLLKQLGGSMQGIIQKNLKLNYNLAPHIWKHDGKHGVKAGEMAKPCAIKLCTNCNTVNFVWQSSMQGERPLEDLHCGVCFFGLDNLLSQDSWFLPTSIIVDITQLRVGAMELKFSEIMNQRDGSDAMNATTLRTLTNQDIKNMRSIMSRRDFKQIRVNNGLTDKQLTYLKQHNLSFQIVMNRNTPNPHAMLAAERKVVWYSFMEKVAHHQLALEIGARHPRDLATEHLWHGIGPIMDWRDVERYATTNDKPTQYCDHTVANCNCANDKTPTIISIDSLYDITPKDVMDLMLRTGAERLFYTLSTAAVNFGMEDGELFFNQGSWYRDGEKFLCTLNSDDRPYENSWYLTKLWSTADAITTDTHTLQLNTYNTIGNHIMRVGILTSDKLLKTKYTLSNKGVQDLQIDVPMIQHDSWIAQATVPIIRYESRIVDMNLFKALYIRNLNGALSFRKIVEFGMAYAHTKYTTPTRVVSYHHLSADDVRLHALLATVHSRRKMGWLTVAHDSNDPNATCGVNWGSGIWMAALDYVVNAAREYNRNYLSDYLDEATYDTFKSNIVKWLEEPFWDVLDQLSECNFQMGLVVYNAIDKPSGESVSNYSVCGHHVENCVHPLATELLCECCEFVAAEHEGLCTCCARDKCKHKCSHKCVDPAMHTAGQAPPRMCDCCGINYTTEVCMQCIVNLGKNNQAFEPQLSTTIKESVLEEEKVSYKSRLLAKDVPAAMKERMNARRQIFEITFPKLQRKSTRVTTSQTPTAPVHTTRPQLAQTTELTEQQTTVVVDENPSLDNLQAHIDRMAEINALHPPPVQGLTNEESPFLTYDPMIEFLRQKQAHQQQQRLAALGDISPTPGHIQPDSFQATRESEPHQKDVEPTVEPTPIERSTSEDLTDHLVFELTKLTDLQYPMVLSMGYGHALHEGLLDMCDPNPTDTIGVSQLKYFPSGRVVLPTCNFEILQRQEVPGDGLCGYHALRHTVGSEAVLADLQLQSGRENWFDNEQLANYLSSLGKNSLILTTGMSEVTTANSADTNYICIMHGEVVTPGRLHWEPVSVLQIELDGQFPCWNAIWGPSALNKVCQRQGLWSDGSNMSINQRLTVAIELVGKYNNSDPKRPSEQRHIKLYSTDGKWWLSNNTNNKQEIRAGFFNFEIGMDYIPYVELAVADRLTNELRDLQYDTYDVEPMHSADPVKTLKSHCLNICNSIGSIHRQAIGNDTYSDNEWTLNVVKLHNARVGLRSFALGDLKLKTGDSVMLDMGVMKAEVFVVVSENQVYFSPPIPLSRTDKIGRIYVPKQSYKSLLLQLHNIMKPKVDWNSFKHLITTSTVVYGPAGSGKTTRLSKELHRGDIAIARTRVARDNLRNMLPKEMQVITYEHYSTVNPVCDRLMVEECTMFGWLDLYLAMTHLPRTLFMVGDPYQIGMIDSSNLGGTRHINPASDSSRNIQQINTTYRYGKSLAEILTESGVRVTSVAAHDTAIVWQQYEQFDENEFKTTIRIHKPNIVLTFYNKIKEKLKKLTKTPVDTIHSYQSKEADVVMVVQASEGGQDSKIWLNQQYCLSAATRCKRKLVWMAVGLPRTTSLVQLIRGTTIVTKTGGYTDVAMETLQGALELADLSQYNDAFTGQLMTEPGKLGPRMGGAFEDVTLINELQTSHIDNLLELSNNTILHNWCSNTIAEIADEMRTLVPRGISVANTDMVLTIGMGFTGTVTMTASPSNAIMHVEYSNMWVRSTAHKTILREYQQGVRRRMDVIIINQQSLQWFEGLPNELKLLIHDKTPIPTKLVSKYGKPDEQGFYDTQEGPEHVLEHPEQLEPTNQRIIRFAYSVPDELIKSCAIRIMKNVYLTLIKQPRATYSVIQITCDNAMCLQYTSTNTSMEISIDFDATNNVLTAFIESQAAIWNEHIIEQYQTTNLWKQIYPSQRTYVLKHFCTPTPTTNSTFHSDAQLTEDLKLMIEHHTGQTPVLTRPPFGSVGKLKLPSKDTVVVTDPYNSVSSQHYCTDAQSWWKNEVNDPLFSKLTISTTSSALTAVRLVADSTQMFEQCGIQRKVSVAEHWVKVHTFGGCALCCGLVFERDGLVILKISPQKCCSKTRYALVRHGFGEWLSVVVLHALNIESDCIERLLGRVNFDVSYKSMCLPHVFENGYEMGMILERICSVPAALWEKTWKAEPTKLCTQHHAENAQHVNDINKNLNNGWHVASDNKIGSHQSIVGAAIKVRRSRDVAIVALHGNEMLTTDLTAIAPNTHCTKMSLQTLFLSTGAARGNRWQWKVTRWLKNTTSFNKKIGAFDENNTNSLNLPMSYHKDNSTEVYAYFQNRRESEIIASMKKVSHIVFVHTKQWAAYNHILTPECLNQPIETQFYDLIETGFDQLVENITLKWFYNSLPTNGRTLVMTPYPYLGMANSCWGTHCHYVSNHLKTRYRMNLGDCNPIMNKIEANYITKQDQNRREDNTKHYYHVMEGMIKHQQHHRDGPWFTEHTEEVYNKFDFLFLGLGALQMDPDAIVALIGRVGARKIHMVCPLLFDKEENTLFRVVASDEVSYEVAYDGVRHTTTINKQTLDCILQGKIATVGGLKVVFHSTTVVMGHAIAQIVVCRDGIRTPSYCKPQIQTAAKKYVSFSVPQVSDLRHALRSGQVVESRQVNIESRLYRQLCNRMLRPETTFNDLLIYARSFAQTISYSSMATIAKTPRYDSKLMEAALCVYHECTRANKSIEHLAELLDNSYKPMNKMENITGSVKTLMLTAFGHLTKLLQSEVTIDELVEMSKSLLKRNPRKLIANLHKFTAIKITKLSPNPRLIKRGDGSKLRTTLLDFVESTHMLCNNSSELAIKGASKWWHHTWTSNDSTWLHTPQHSESAISAVARYLETRDGESLIEAVMQLPQPIRQQYTNNELKHATEIVLRNVRNPIGCKPARSATQQINEDLNQTLPFRNKSVTLGAVCTPKEIKTMTVAAYWMYPDQIVAMMGKTIVFSTIGSMGDIEPFISLAEWLKEFNVICKFIVPEDYLEHTTRKGYETIGLNVDSSQLINHCIEFDNPNSTLVNRVKAIIDTLRLTANVFDVNTNMFIQFTKNADLILETPFTNIGAQLAQYHGTPFLSCAAYPWEYGHGRNTKAQRQSLAEFIGGALTYVPFLQQMVDWREKKLGLTNSMGLLLATGGTPSLYLHPMETSNWKISRCSRVIGTAECPVKNIEPDELNILRWCAAKSTTAICFGSMVGANRDRAIQRAIIAAKQLTAQVVVVNQTNQFGTKQQSEDVKEVGRINYHALFTTTTVVITHGGSGTTHNALKHGNVVVIEPFFGDQFAWAKSVVSHGVGWKLTTLETELLKNPGGTQQALEERVNNASKLASRINSQHCVANLVCNFSTLIALGAENTKKLLHDEYWVDNSCMPTTNEKFSRLLTKIPSWGDEETIEQQVECVLEHWEHTDNNLLPVNQASPDSSDISSQSTDDFTQETESDTEQEHLDPPLLHLQPAGTPLTSDRTEMFTAFVQTSIDKQLTDVPSYTTPSGEQPSSILDPVERQIQYYLAIIQADIDMLGTEDLDGRVQQEMIPHLQTTEHSTSSEGNQSMKSATDEFTLDEDTDNIGDSHTSALITNVETPLAVLEGDDYMPPPDVTDQTEPQVTTHAETKPLDESVVEPHEVHQLPLITRTLEMPLEAAIPTSTRTKSRQKSSTRSTRRPQHEPIPKSIVGIIQEETTPIFGGLWTTNQIRSKLLLPSVNRAPVHKRLKQVVLGTLLYNPTDSGKCVVDCLEYCVSRHYNNVYEGPDELIKRVKNMCTNNVMPIFEELLAMVVLLGTKLVIVAGDSKVWMNCNLDGPQQCIHITYARGVGHATVHALKSTLDGGQMTVATTPLKHTTIKVLDILLLHGVSDDEARNLLNSSSNLVDQIRNRLGIDIRELKSKLKLTNLVHTIERHNVTCGWITCKTDTKLVSVKTMPFPIVTGQIVLMHTNIGFQAAMCVDTGTECVMVLQSEKPQKLLYYPLVIRTEIKLLRLTPRTRRVIIKGLPEGMGQVTCLNEATKKYMTVEVGRPEINTINSAQATDLIIHNYDGRKHHKYDELDIIKRFEPSKIHGTVFKYTAQLHKMLCDRSTKWRLSIDQGKPTIVLEIKNQHLQCGTFTILSFVQRALRVKADTITLICNKLSKTDYEHLELICDRLSMEQGCSTKSHPAELEDWVTMSEKTIKGLQVDYDNLKAILMDNPDKYQCKLANPQYVMLVGEASPIAVTCMKINSTMILFTRLMINVVIQKIPEAAGYEDGEQVLWKLPQQFKAGKHSRWWDVTEDLPASKFDPEKWQQVLNSEALNAAYCMDVTVHGGQQGEIVQEQYGDQFFVPAVEWQVSSQPIEFSHEIPSFDDICFWEDQDLTDWNDKYGPENDMTITSRIPPTQLRLSEKSTLVEYPCYSRPVLTKAANQEFNAITGRLGRVTKYRKVDYNIEYEWAQFRDTYFDPNKLQLLNDYKEQQLTFNDHKMMDWLRSRPDGNKVAAEVDMILKEGPEIHPINNVKLHLKLESLLKDEPATNIRQVKPRPLVWQTKGYCALFSHAFKELKQRLKALLKHNIVYTDGLRADEVASRVRATGDFKHIIENDLAQQDRQTDHQIIEFEMYLYKQLGMHKGMVDIWHKCHHHWRYKAATAMGIRDAMRLTGQATTALGNVITNLLVHRRLVSKLGSSLKLFLVLGDDGLILSDTMVDLTKLNHEMKINHNMMCKPHTSTTVGTFCCMLVARNHLGHATLGPDFIRMKRRFEVTNGVCAANDSNLTARAMSYAMMLGRTVEIQNLIKRKQWPIEPMRWYDQSSLMQACATKYGTSITEVHNNYMTLIHMMTKLQVWNYSYLHWEEKM